MTVMEVMAQILSPVVKMHLLHYFGLKIGLSWKTFTTTFYSPKPMECRRLFIFLCLLAVSVGRTLRSRRQAEEEEEIEESYQLPWRAPFPGRSASVLSPVFPFVGQYEMGLLLDDGTSPEIDGFLNIPIPTWGIFDFSGEFQETGSDLLVGVGLLGNPLNVLDIAPEAVVGLAANPGFQAAREQTEEVAVGLLPGNYAPLRCKPPFCNPFIHNLGVGVEVEPADDTGIAGALDFPIPLAPLGTGIRFPLSGAFNQVTSPFIVTFGQKLGPLDPFGGQSNPIRPLIPGIQGQQPTQFTAWPSPENRPRRKRMTLRELLTKE